MKRILIFSLAYYPSNVSGAEAAIKEITDRIEPTDIEFHMITLLFDKAAPREEYIGHVHVHRIGFGGAYLSKILYIPVAALTAISLNRKLHFDALWSMMTYMLFPVVLAKWLGLNVPHVLTLQDGDPYEKVFERPFIKPVAFILDDGFRSASIVQVISSFLGEWPRKRGYKGKIEIIYNGANPKNLAEDYSVEYAKILRDSLGKKSGDIYLLNVARLVHQKANDQTIKALALLPANIYLLLIGSGPDEEMLRQTAKDSGVEDRVKFLGQIERTEVVKYRNPIVADIFVCPSRSEGLQMSSLSAMAARLPVIATQEGGLAEYIFDDIHNPDEKMTAWVVDKDSPEQISQAVQKIIANPEQVKKVTTDARAMILEKYDWDKIAVQMRERVFGTVLK